MTHSTPPPKANYQTLWQEEPRTPLSHPSLPDYQTIKLSDIKSKSNYQATWPLTLYPPFTQQ